MLKVWCHCTSKSFVGLRSMVMRKTRWVRGKNLSSKTGKARFLSWFVNYTPIINTNISYIPSLRTSHYKLLVWPNLESTSQWLLFSTPLKFLEVVSLAVSCLFVFNISGVSWVSFCVFFCFCFLHYIKHDTFFMLSLRSLYRMRHR